MNINAIVAAARNGAIGKDGKIPWYLPNDLKYFKKTTLNHPIIMGRKSFESLGRPLPKRTNIVITRDMYYAASGALVCHSLSEALSLANAENQENCFIIGGGEIYRLAWDLLDRVYYTDVDTVVEEADTFFPAIDPTEWKEISSEPQPLDEKHTIPYTFKVFDRIT